MIRDPGPEDRGGGHAGGWGSQCRESWWLENVDKGEDGSECGAKEFGPY